jgi:hypothetical protein
MEEIILKRIEIKSIHDLPRKGGKYFVTFHDNDNCIVHFNENSETIEYWLRNVKFWFKENSKEFKLEDIAKIIANKANMPYCWESIKERLENGIELPFKLKDD